MRKYRIKIEENRLGIKSYTPQVKLGFFKNWENIVQDSILNSFSISSTTRHLYNTEKDALLVIEGYKKMVQKRHSEETKKITYKNL